MTFPTIPTGGRIISVFNADTNSTRTSPDLSTLTKNAGDLLIAICIIYDGNSTNAEFSAWGAGWIEFVDQTTTATMGIGCAYKFSTGSETGTFTVTTTASQTGHAVWLVMAIEGAHASTPPAGGTIVNGTGAAADPTDLNPADWDVEDTLWVLVGGCGETNTGGSFTAIDGGNPTNYTSIRQTGTTADVVGGVAGSVAFRQNAVASEAGSTFTVDITNARNSALLIGVRPAAVAATFSPPFDHPIRRQVPLLVR